MDVPYPFADPLPAAERLAAVRLARTEGIGPIAFGRLLARFGSPAAALEALPGLAQAAGRARPLTLCPPRAARAELARIDRLGGRLLVRGEPGYPAILATLPDPPSVLTVLGDAALLGRPAVAIVGARNASLNGRRLAAQLAADLAASGLLVVSGLARGVDGAAHQGALAGSGTTVAVVAGGADHVYPPEHAGLHRAVIGQGAVVAEAALGAAPTARCFPRRNRIIAGLSLAVVVIEAALGSGSLITARMALDAGRLVLAVPGSPLDPRCRGSNDLLRQGATLVEGADDVQAAVAPLLETAMPARRRLPAGPPAPPVPAAAELPRDAGDALRRLVLDGLGPEPTEVDEIVRRCQVSPAVVADLLLELELAGCLERHPGNAVSRVS